MKETFGQRFLRLRKARGLTQEDIANALVAMTENLDSAFNEDVDSQGFFSKAISFLTTI